MQSMKEILRLTASDGCKPEQEDDVPSDKGSLQVSGADRADLEWVRQCAEMRSDSDVLIRGAAGEEVFNIGDLRELIGIALSSPSSTNATLPPTSIEREKAEMVDDVLELLGIPADKWFSLYDVLASRSAIKPPVSERLAPSDEAMNAARRTLKGFEGSDYSKIMAKELVRLAAESNERPDSAVAAVPERKSPSEI